MQIAWHVNVQISSSSDESQARKIPQKCNFLSSMIVFTWGRGCCSNKKGAWKAPWVKCRKWFWRNFLACKRNHNESFESLSKTSLHLQPNFTWCYSQVLYSTVWSSSTFTNILKFGTRKPTKCTTSCKHSKPFKFEAKCRKELKPKASNDGVN